MRRIWRPTSITRWPFTVHQLVQPAEIMCRCASQCALLRSPNEAVPRGPSVSRGRRCPGRAGGHPAFQPAGGLAAGAHPTLPINSDCLNDRETGAVAQLTPDHSVVTTRWLCVLSNAATSLPSRSTQFFTLVASAVGRTGADGTGWLDAAG